MQWATGANTNVTYHRIEDHMLKPIDLSDLNTGRNLNVVVFLTEAVVRFGGSANASLYGPTTDPFNLTPTSS
jgi:hypothetical protein